jgi:predicted CXXCH cytochrome family protein
MGETCTQCHFGIDYLTSAHGDGTEGVERVITEPATVGECSQCHYMHASVNGEPTGGPHPYNLYTENRNGLCFDPSSQSGCHQNVPFGYPAQETDRVPDGSPHAGYFEYSSGEGKITGVNNRKRWPGMVTYSDTRTFGTGQFYSPHRNDPDMPVRDPDGNGLCGNCHNPHGTMNPFDMLKGTYQEIGGAEEVRPPTNYELCFQCHGPDGPIGMDEESRRIADFYDSRINHDDKVGHQIRLSKKSALSWPSHVEKGDKLPCYDCHNSHGSMGNDGVQPNGFLISDQRPGWSGLTDTLNDPIQNRRFCFGCHIPADGIPGSQSVEGIVMNTIPNRREHRSDGSTSCYECHGNDYSSPNANNVHHPDIGGHGIGEVFEDREEW